MTAAVSPNVSIVITSVAVTFYRHFDGNHDL